MEVFDAIDRARQYIERVYRDDEVADILPEEVARSEDGKTWFITVGYTRPQRETLEAGIYPEWAKRFRILAGRPLEREYKVVSIDDPSGTVTSMKIREFSQAG